MKTKLIKLRKSLKLSRREVAEHLNIGERTYNRIEKGELELSGKPYMLSVYEADLLYRLFINKGEELGRNFQSLEEIDIYNLLLE